MNVYFPDYQFFPFRFLISAKFQFKSICLNSIDECAMSDFYKSQLKIEVLKLKNQFKSANHIALLPEPKLNSIITSGFNSEIT